MRSLSISLPKDNDFPRNVHGTLHSTFHRLNNGIAVSAVEKLEQVSVQLSGRSVRALQQMQRKVEYQKERAKDRNTMTYKLVRKGRQVQEHLRYKPSHSVKSDYSKAQLDPNKHQHPREVTGNTAIASLLPDKLHTHAHSA